MEETEWPFFLNLSNAGNLPPPVRCRTVEKLLNTGSDNILKQSLTGAFRQSKSTDAINWKGSVFFNLIFCSTQVTLYQTDCVTQAFRFETMQIVQIVPVYKFYD